MVDSRSALLAAAAEEFARDGFKGARVQAIVTRAGVNERMIYHHFGSKDGLYAAVLATQLEGLWTAWRPALEAALRMDPYAGMRVALGGYFDVLLARPALAGLMVHEALGGWRALPSPDIATPLLALGELYGRGQAEGVFRSDCTFEVACATATGALCGLIVLCRLRPIGAPGLREQALGQLLDGMSGPVRTVNVVG
jgi:AcrR family transcriptional regulator